MDDTLKVARAELQRFLKEHPKYLVNLVYQREWVEGFVAVFEAVDAGEDPKRVALAYASQGFDDGRDYALAMLSID